VAGASLASLPYNAEEVLKTYELFIRGDVQYITNSFCKSMLNLLKPSGNFTYHQV
jgi:hypothetical protein